MSTLFASATKPPPCYTFVKAALFSNTKPNCGMNRHHTPSVLSPSPLLPPSFCPMLSLINGHHTRGAPSPLSSTATPTRNTTTLPNIPLCGGLHADSSLTRAHKPQPTLHTPSLAPIHDRAARECTPGPALPSMLPTTCIYRDRWYNRPGMRGGGWDWVWCLGEWGSDPTNAPK